MSEWLPITEYRRLPAESGIYILRCKVSRKEYVGLSNNVRRRVRDHLKPGRPDYCLYRAMAKHGVDQFEVCVYILAALSELPDIEQRLVAERNTMSPHGYNLTAGGEGTIGRVLSEATKEKLRAARLGKSMPESARAKIREAAETLWTPEMRAKVSAAGKGKVRSAETRARMSEANRNRPPEHWARVAEKTRNRVVSESTRAKMSEHAKNRTELHRARIATSNKGKTASAETKEKMSQAKRKIVLIWVPDSMIPMVFPSAAIAGKWYGKDGAFVSLYISGRLKTPDGSAICYA